MVRNGFRHGLFRVAALLCVPAALVLPDRGIAAEAEQTRNLAAAISPLTADSSTRVPRPRLADTTSRDHFAVSVNPAPMFRAFGASLDSGAVPQIANMPASEDNGGGSLIASDTSFATIISVAPAAAIAGSDLRVGATVASAYSVGSGPNVNAVRVPEPETYAMILAGLGLMGFVARRRSQEQEHG